MPNQNVLCTTCDVFVDGGHAAAVAWIGKDVFVSTTLGHWNLLSIETNQSFAAATLSTDGLLMAYGINDTVVLRGNTKQTNSSSSTDDDWALYGSLIGVSVLIVGGAGYFMYQKTMSSRNSNGLYSLL